MQKIIFLAYTKTTSMKCIRALPDCASDSRRRLVQNMFIQKREILQLF